MAADIERVAYEGADGDMVGAAFVPPSPPSPSEDRVPGLLLVHELTGLDAHIERSALRFAAEGYAVLAPDLWSREGAAGASVPDRRALRDLEAGFEWLAKREDVDAKRLAVVGFGMGGNYAFQLGCTSRRVAAVVDYCGELIYPELSRERPIQPLELALNLSCPVLFHFGHQDAPPPADHVLGLETILAQFAKNYEIETWAGAGDRFFNDGHAGYHEPSAQAAWDRTLHFLREEFD